MSPRFINQKSLERAERITEIATDFAECNSVKELNAIVSTSPKEMQWPEVRKRYAAAVKRIEAVEINKNFNYKN